MDFFEAQARAKQRTSRLVWLFALAVTGTIALSYFAAVFGLNYAQSTRSGRDRYGHRVYYNDVPATLWRPQVFFAVSAGTLLIVGLASLYKWSEYSAGAAPSPKASAPAASIRTRPTPTNAASSTSSRTWPSPPASPCPSFI